MSVFCNGAIARWRSILMIVGGLVSWWCSGSQGNWHLESRVQAGATRLNFTFHVCRQLELEQ